MDMDHFAIKVYIFQSQADDFSDAQSARIHQNQQGAMLEVAHFVQHSLNRFTAQKTGNLRSFLGR